MAEATSLHAIRTVLEDLEDHLDFLQGAGIGGSRGMRASRARSKRLQGDDGGMAHGAQGSCTVAAAMAQGAQGSCTTTSACYSANALHSMQDLKVIKILSSIYAEKHQKLLFNFKTAFLIVLMPREMLKMDLLSGSLLHRYLVLSALDAYLGNALECIHEDFQSDLHVDNSRNNKSTSNLHTDCLAILANTGPHVHRLSAYASQRLVSLFDMLSRKYAKLAELKKFSALTVIFDQIDSDNISDS